ncbi:CamS family sex pheromone protein [Geobacillus thermodenitrificans]|uniref:CamS family sex pheromone protein n=1 Tax=Geobacillus TaxID=129337 RepID=UPI00148CF587|nr:MULTISPECIES: CamS family sex pheromone protein [Geobacillus]MEC5189446.1 protein involved in sex pheromone biosynthesis [Geobacillus thermodenitrificans]MED3716186.1 CamS family sex pheromone protein [Geobacillus thermodenitrificans]MED4916444.1 CamS family sex pheromone protein [Geobacillus thermodenitrificans]NNU87868.1 CamS family sex pheromone protein [Geobacillus sp. MR]
MKRISIISSLVACRWIKRARKRLAVLGLASFCLLSACAPKFDQGEEVVQNKGSKEQEAVIPKYNISDSYYRVVLPFKPSGARGQVVGDLNTRLDVDEFETGLMRLASEQFPTDDYLFQEGQYLDGKTVNKWLERKRTSNQLKEEKMKPEDNIGLNPPISDTGTNEQKNKQSPIYLASILEHDYLVKVDNDKVKLGGVAIGLALNSVHYYSTEQGYPREVKIKDDVIEREGKKIAAEVLKRLRNIKGLGSVPITIALYKQAPRSSVTPGHFFAVTHVDEGSNTIDKWEAVNEEYYLFPSDEAEKNHRDDWLKFNNFKSDVEDFFPNYTGIVGKGLYVNDQLQKLTINITIPFYGKTEVIGFTQYVTGLVMEKFPDYITVNVYISSTGQPESLIVRQAKVNEPFVHIYR